MKLQSLQSISSAIGQNQPSKDICAYCFKFYNCHKFSSSPASTHFTAKDHTAETEDVFEELGRRFDSLLIDGCNVAATTEDEEAERMLLRAARHVQSARVQRRLFNDKTKQAIDDLSDTSLRHCERTRTLLVDYGQNMALPWFGANQPGEVYYYTPLNIFNLGVVNMADKVGTVNDTLLPCL